MMFPQLGVTELVFTLIQQMIKRDTNDLKTPGCRSAYSMPYVTTSIAYYTIANCCELCVLGLRSVGSI